MLTDDLCAHLRAHRVAHDWNATTVSLAGRAWNLFPEEAPETVIYPSNNDCGPVRSPLLLEGLHGLTIDGEGARLLVRGTPQAGRGSTAVLYPPVVPVILRDCHRITLKNFSLDWATPGTFQGTCIAIPAPDTFEVSLETSQRTWCWNGQLYLEGEGWTWPVRRLLAADAETGAILPGTGDNLGAGYDVNWHYDMPRDGVVRISGPTTARPALGCKILFWCSHHDVGGRRAPALFIENSSAITLQDITVHYAWAMGLIAQNSTDISLRRFNVEPSGTRKFSLAADGTHFVNCRGHLRFDDCPAPHLEATSFASLTQTP